MIRSSGLPRLFLLFAVCCALLRLAAPAQNQDRSIFDEIGQDLQELAEISGLKLRHQVPYDLISKDQVNQFLKDRLRDAGSPEDLRIEELALKKFGFVASDFDLAKTTVELLTEQAAAFYDFHKKKLYITDWAPPSMRQAALVHELAHALADQNFRLERFIKQGRESDDLSMAHMAVMEGQATWLMSEAMARRTGQSLKNSNSTVEMLSRSMESGPGEYPVFDGSPLYLRRTLVFPYTQGMLFQHAVVQKMGQAGFAEVFRRAPVSTQQILHPEKYFDDVKPAHPELPKLLRNRGYKRLIEGTVGELDHSILLAQYLTEQRAHDIAPHWRGGAYALHENKRERRVVLAYASEWEDAGSARRFFESYQDVLRKKWRAMEVKQSNESLFAGHSDDGYFRVRLDGSVVTSLEGLAEPAVN
jgi:hypothetical protein